MRSFCFDTSLQLIKAIGMVGYEGKAIVSVLTCSLKGAQTLLGWQRRSPGQGSKEGSNSHTSYLIFPTPVTQ